MLTFPSSFHINQVKCLRSKHQRITFILLKLLVFFGKILELHCQFCRIALYQRTLQLPLFERLCKLLIHSLQLNFFKQFRLFYLNLKNSGCNTNNLIAHFIQKSGYIHFGEKYVALQKQFSFVITTSFLSIFFILAKFNFSTSSKIFQIAIGQLSLYFLVLNL